MTRAEFERAHPGRFFLDPSDPAALESRLRDLGVLAATERIRSVAPAGPGNMNCVVRVTTDTTSWIVKQSRPWVEKYPQFAAPEDRVLRERDFYRLVEGVPGVADRMPRCRASDDAARLLVLEDLGPGADGTGLYAGEASWIDSALDPLADFLSILHGWFDDRPCPIALTNRAMRALNAEHIFFLPLRENNGLDLDRLQPGLAAAAAPLQSDRRLVETVERLGHEVYLADGPSLLHGDFFPGSLLHSPAGPRVIDPEFAFLGRPEFDVAVFLAHLTLAGQPQSLGRKFLAHYRPGRVWQESLVWQLAGIEIIRRLVGYAQLPLPRSLATKRELLERARAWVLQPPSHE